MKEALIVGFAKIYKKRDNISLKEAVDILKQVIKENQRVTPENMEIVKRAIERDERKRTNHH